MAASTEMKERGEGGVGGESTRRKRSAVRVVVRMGREGGGRRGEGSGRVRISEWVVGE